MKKQVFLMVLTAISLQISASNLRVVSETDTTAVEELHEVVVQGVRAQKNAPYAVANIQKKELQAFSTTGRELPMLFSQTPGVLAWSENGLGTGTTYLRIRGAAERVGSPCPRCGGSRHVGHHTHHRVRLLHDVFRQLG